MLAVALDQLNLGRVHLQQALSARGGYQAESPQGIQQAALWLDQAVAGLRTAGAQCRLPRSLLTRAVLHRHTGDFPRAHQDLQEVFVIAERSGMHLHLTDYHLETAHLSLAEGNADQSRHRADSAEELIEATGYKRLLPELAELQEQLN